MFSMVSSTTDAYLINRIRHRDRWIVMHFVHFIHRAAHTETCSFTSIQIWGDKQYTESIKCNFWNRIEEFFDRKQGFRCRFFAKWLVSKHTWVSLHRYKREKRSTFEKMACVGSKQIGHEDPADGHRMLWQQVDNRWRRIQWESSSKKSHPACQ